MASNPIPEPSIVEKLNEIKKQLIKFRHDSIKGLIGAMNDVVTQIEWYERRIVKRDFTRVLQHIQSNKVIDYITTLCKSSQIILDETKGHAKTDKDAVTVDNHTSQLHAIVEAVMKLVLDCYFRAENGDSKIAPDHDLSTAKLHLEKAKEAERFEALKSELAKLADIQPEASRGIKRPRDDDSSASPAKTLIWSSTASLGPQAAAAHSSIETWTTVKQNDKDTSKKPVVKRIILRHKPANLQLSNKSSTSTMEGNDQEKPFQEDWVKLDQLAKDNPYPDRQTQEKMLPLAEKLLPLAERYYNHVKGSPVSAGLPSQEVLEQRFPELRELHDQQRQADSDIHKTEDEIKALEPKIAILTALAHEKLNDEQKRQAILYDFALQKLKQNKEKALETQELAEQGIAVLHALVSSEPGPLESRGEQSLGFPDDGEAIMAVLQLRKLLLILENLLLVGDKAAIGYCISPEEGQRYAIC